MSGNPGVSSFNPAWVGKLLSRCWRRLCHSSAHPDEWLNLGDWGSLAASSDSVDRSMRMIRLIGSMALVVLSGSSLLAEKAKAKPAAAKAPVGERSTYKKVGERELGLWVLKPEGWKAEDHRPCMVFFHGGGWVGGGPTQFNEQATLLAGKGLVCVQVEYRLLTKQDADATPAKCVADAKSAMRWVRAHAAKLGIDPLRIGAGGGSAGGHLAAFVGMVEGGDDATDDLKISPRPQALVLFNPVLDNGPDQGWGYARVGDRYKEFSPAHAISADDPPALFMLGTQDKLIPVAVAKRFEAGMKAAGVRCELRLYEGQGHGFFNGKPGDPFFDQTVAEMMTFLRSLGWIAE